MLAYNQEQGRRQLRPSTASEPVRTAITGIHIANWEWSGAVTGELGLHQCVPWPALGTHSGPSCSSTAPLMSEGTDVGSGGECTHRGTRTSSDLTLRALAPAPWD